MQPTPDPDALRDTIARLNQDRNGNIPIIGQHARKSGWVCPRCGQDAEQVASPLGVSPRGDPVGIRWETLDDGRPKPVHVGTSLVVGFETAPDGMEDKSKPKLDSRLHCLNCFNVWQKQKMMQEIRDNVPVLRYTGDEDAPSSSPA